MLGLIGVAVLALLSTSLAAQESSPRTLAVLHSAAVQHTHSQFFKSLEERGHVITYTTVDRPNAIYSYGERIYDNLVIFAPQAAKLGDFLSVENILMFVDDGGNVLTAGSAKPGHIMQELAKAAGYSLPTSDSAVIDFFDAHQNDDGKGTLFLVDSATTQNVVRGKAVNGPLLYNGTGFKQGRSSLAFPLLSAPSTAYLGTADKPAPAHPLVSGSDIVLVGALQAINSARLVLIGSLDALGDEFGKAEAHVDGRTVPCANQAFANEVAKWAFREKGVLRSRNTNVTALEPKAPGSFTVKDEVLCSMVLEELVDGQWVPFSGQRDVQLQYTRMEPHIIMAMQPGPDGLYTASFALPDVYGLFTFKVHYLKPGYTLIDEDDVEVIRPLTNTMHSRFLIGAYPYYVSAYVVMAGVFLLTLVFLYHSDAPAKAKTE